MLFKFQKSKITEHEIYKSLSKCEGIIEAEEKHKPKLLNMIDGEMVISFVAGLIAKELLGIEV